ncbi:MAG: hypothetical protein M3N26_03575 [Pseudomonadota bacterium]|nr:hypothetical protein [Pseudomonadota bacterium]
MDIGSIISALSQSGGVQTAASNSGASATDTQNIMQGALEHADQGGSMETMIDSVAQKAGVNPSLVNQVLPHILPLIESHMSGMGGGAATGGGLTGMLGGLLGGVR